MSVAISSRVLARAAERYTERCVPQPNVSVALSLLAFWDRPWSSNAQRFAYHAIGRALRLGFDVLDA